MDSFSSLPRFTSDTRTRHRPARVIDAQETAEGFALATQGTRRTASYSKPVDELNNNYRETAGDNEMTEMRLGMPGRWQVARERLSAISTCASTTAPGPHLRRSGSLSHSRRPRQRPRGNLRTGRGQILGVCPTRAALPYRDSRWYGAEPISPPVQTRSPVVFSRDRRPARPDGETGAGAPVSRAATRVPARGQDRHRPDRE